VTWNPEQEGRETAKRASFIHLQHTFDDARYWRSSQPHTYTNTNRTGHGFAALSTKERLQGTSCCRPGSALHVQKHPITIRMQSAAVHHTQHLLTPPTEITDEAPRAAARHQLLSVRLSPAVSLSNSSECLAAAACAPASNMMIRTQKAAVHYAHPLAICSRRLQIQQITHHKHKVLYRVLTLLRSCRPNTLPIKWLSTEHQKATARRVAVTQRLSATCAKASNSIPMQ
jgi:hypothetical protein